MEAAPGNKQEEEEHRSKQHYEMDSMTMEN
jgi:hypothetical protein